MIEIPPVVELSLDNINLVLRHIQEILTRLEQKVDAKTETPKL